MKDQTSAKTPKQWVIKILAEFTVSIILAMIIIFIGLFFGIQPNEVIRIQDSKLPIFVVYILIIYGRLFCTFPASGRIPIPAKK